MPGIFRYSIDQALEQIQAYFDQGIGTFALFPCLPHEKKSWTGKEAFTKHALIPKALTFFRRFVPEACLIADVALDPFTSHGHDGILGENHEVLNDVTVHYLAKMALLYANSGADMVAPSDMMDGRVLRIRQMLDEGKSHNTAILAYSAKYASCFYKPFREALDSAPAGDKKSYQLDPANQREALLEAHLDEEEHADILMVKPAGMYLDVIQSIRKQTKRPLAAYHVSGEYAMVMAAHQQGILVAKEAFLEILTSIKRAGADLIFSYALDHVLGELL